MSSAWVYSGLAIRFMSPLGLNCLEDCIAYETGEKPPPRILLPPLQSVTEKYERYVPRASGLLRAFKLTSPSQGRDVLVWVSNGPLHLRQRWPSACHRGDRHLQPLASSPGF